MLFKICLIIYKGQLSLALNKFFLINFFLLVDYLSIKLISKTSCYLFCASKIVKFLLNKHTYQTNNYSSKLLINFINNVISNLTKALFYCH